MQMLGIIKNFEYQAAMDGAGGGVDPPPLQGLWAPVGRRVVGGLVPTPRRDLS